MAKTNLIARSIELSEFRRIAYKHGIKESSLAEYVGDRLAHNIIYDSKKKGYSHCTGIVCYNYLVMVGALSEDVAA